MKIIVDDKIPFINGVLEDFAQVIYLPGSQIGPHDVNDCDALLVRTRTTCNEALLERSKVNFIGTATIGYDHIDIDWCKKKGVKWTNAPGCNADSVEQYIAASLLHWAKTHNKNLSALCIGIVGVGHVGSRVAKTCSLLGMRVLLNDPPRERSERPAQFVDLDTIASEADIISFHVPLNKFGQDKTFHLVDTPFLNSVKPGALLINSCRGEVFNTESTIEAIKKQLIAEPIIDCWENEPQINLELLQSSFLATPHIAGYSKDGKANGTEQIVNALAKHFNLPLRSWNPTGIPSPLNPDIKLDPAGKSDQELLAEAILFTYPIWDDDTRLKENPSIFEELRGNYPLRREYKAYNIKPGTVPVEILKKLEELGFKILND